MRLGELVEILGLEALVPGDPDREVTGGYVSDLLSDVMAHARAGAVWVTIQTHQNVVAVASLLSLAAVIVAGGYRPEAETLAKAAAEGVAVYAAADSSFAVAGRLYGLGLR
ncbi:MAG: serine kinase [Firmicutes bacterium]|nr:serine kinase [Bacillota bacterium]